MQKPCPCFHWFKRQRDDVPKPCSVCHCHYRWRNKVPEPCTVCLRLYLWMGDESDSNSACTIFNIGGMIHLILAQIALFFSVRRRDNTVNPCSTSHFIWNRGMTYRTHVQFDLTLRLRNHVHKLCAVCPSLAPKEPHSTPQKKSSLR